VFSPASATATAQFQKAHGLSADGSGILGVETAQKLLDLHSADGYKDSGFTAASMGYLFKLHVPVHSNRSIETVSTLYDKNNNVLLSFTTRTHGHR
jgi:peptidoglycan hydrolase-like protein with peptidoglycan-binding domain